MAKNQLFRILPDTEIIQEILETFGLTSLNDTNYFTKETIQENETIDKLIEIKDKLREYYLPCKQTYIDDINEKRCIVILRQFIRVHGYALISKERYINGKKMNVYRLIVDDVPKKPKKKIKEPIVISFS
jgi:hypothetical protein